MKNRKGKSIIIIFLIIVIILIVFAGVAYAYLTTDIFKSEKQLFAKYFINNFQQIKEFDLSKYETFFVENEGLNSEVKFNMEINSTDEEENENVAQLEIISKNDNKNSEMDFDIKLQKEEYLKANLIYEENNDILELKINGLYDKYFALKNENLREFFGKFVEDEEDLEGIPDRIEIDYLNKFSKEDIEKSKELLKESFQGIYRLVEESPYTSLKDVEIIIDNKSFVTNQYNLTISKKELIKELLNSIDILINNPEFVKLYLSDVDDTQIDSIKTAINEYKDEIEDVEDDEKITISVFENEGKTVKTLIAFDEVEISFEIINDVNNNKIIISTKEITEDDNKYYPDSEKIIKLSNKLNGEVNELSLGLEIKYDKDDIKMLNDKNSENSYYSYFTDYAEIYEDSSQQIKMYLKLKEKNILNIKLDLNSIFEEEDLKANIELEIKLDDKIKVENINDDEKIVLNNLSKEELQNLGEQLSENAKKAAEDNPNSIFQEYVKKLQWQSDIIETMNTTTDEMVANEVKEALTICIADYTYNKYSNTDVNVNINDYLTVEKILENCGWNVVEIELIDGSNLKCKDNSGNIYYVQITIYEEDGRYSVGEVKVTGTEKK